MSDNLIIAERGPSGLESVIRSMVVAKIVLDDLASSFRRLALPFQIFKTFAKAEKRGARWRVTSWLSCRSFNSYRSAYRFHLKMIAEGHPNPIIIPVR